MTAYSMEKNPLNVEIEVSRPAGPEIVRDYLDRHAAATGFFGGSPGDPEAYRRKAAEVDRRFDPDRLREMAGAIRAGTPTAAARLETVVSGAGVFVTTGQQAGLFTGPLFTIHKILSAIQLAHALEPVLERPVVPLFWVAGDDHDWAEVNHAHVVDRDNVLHRVGLDGADDPPSSSMGNRRLGPEVERALEEFTGYLPTTEFAGPFLEILREAYRPGRTVAGAFTEAISRLFERFDLLVVESGHPVIKRLAQETYARELASSASHEEALGERVRRLQDAGYRAQVPILVGATNLFFEDERGRERIFRDGDAYVLRSTGRRFLDSEMQRLLVEEPERFSPNVLLRPVVENAVFPTVAYVGGPAEVSYYAQLGPIFESHGITPPVAFPRFSVTMVEAKVRKVLEKFRLQIGDLRLPPQELAARVLRDEMPEELKAATTELRRALTDGYGRMVEATRAIDPTLKGPILAARNAGFMELAEAEKKIMHHLKQRNALGLEQIDKARVNLCPGGEPQERVLTIFQYLIRYGTDLLPALAASMDVRFDAVTAPAR